MDAELLAPHFSDADKAREYLESKRWPDGVVCPHCGVIGEATKLEPKEGTKTHARKGVYKCGGCHEQFTVTVGTIFEDSHIPLNKWLLAFHLLCASKKGMSAHQLHRMLGITYKSAWFMAHRIRYAMGKEPLASKLKGVVEIDETYIGGKIRFGTAPWNGGAPRIIRDPRANKAAVVSFLERSGDVRSFHVERVTSDNLKPILNEMVEEGTHLMTDSTTTLKFPKNSAWKHGVVNHTKKEYARYENGTCISTNAVEGYFGLLKRGINGVYHHVGRQHLNQYLKEFDFRYNARKITDGERTLLALKGADGKRLMLKNPAGKVGV